MESLHKLQNCEDYECVVIDECEANLSVFSSITMRKNQINCLEILSNFIKKSKHTIFTSAFTTQKTIDYINSFNVNSVCIFNKTIPNEKKTFQFKEEILTIKLLENMHSNLLKINYILKLNKFLGIENTCLSSSYIPRDKIESLSNFFIKEIKNINILFGFNIIVKEKWDFNHSMILLKKIYKSWTNSSFNSNSNIHKKVISYNFVPNIVFYNNDVYSNPFYNNKKNIIIKIMTIEDSVIEQKILKNHYKQYIIEK